MTLEGRLGEQELLPDTCRGACVEEALGACQVIEPLPQFTQAMEIGTSVHGHNIWTIMC